MDNLIESAVLPEPVNPGFESLRVVLGDAQAGLDIAQSGGRHTPQERLQAVLANLKEKLLEFDNSSEEKVFTPTRINRPIETKPAVLWADEPVLEFGNISGITSLAGSGKSAVCECHCSSFINPECDSLGISVNAGKVVFVDTERSNHHFHSSWRRYLTRSEISEQTDPPSSCEWFNIRGLGKASERQTWFWQLLEKQPEQTLILLDGAGDMVTDVNAPECVEFISRLCSVVHNKNIACLVTLHINPVLNNLKARGVLGSELWRKSQAIGIIEKNLDSEVRRLTTAYSLGKNRCGADATLAFKWDPILMRHVSSSEIQVTNNKVSNQRKDILKLMGTKTWSHSDLCRAVMESLGKSERTAARMINDLLTIEKIKKTGIGYSLNCRLAELILEPGPGFDFGFNEVSK